MPATVVWHVAGVVDTNGGATLAQPLGSDAPVGAVVAGTGEHDNAATVRATEHLERGAGDGAPARSTSTSTGSLAAASIARISSRVTTGITLAITTPRRRRRRRRDRSA